MKKTLDIKRLIKEAEQRAKDKNSIVLDKEIQSPFIKAFEKLAQADDKNYSQVLKDLKKK